MPDGNPIGPVALFSNGFRGRIIIRAMPDLQKEREDLAKADLDIVEGEKRVTEQIIAIQRMRAAGHDTAQAERLLRNLQDVLEALDRHRRQILEIIAQEE